MSAQNEEERRVQKTVQCGKCGSKAIVAENDYNHVMSQRIPALKCLVCGNRQEEGARCRWPFFEEETGGRREQREPVERGAREVPSYGFNFGAVEKVRRQQQQREQVDVDDIEWDLAS